MHEMAILFSVSCERTIFFSAKRVLDLRQHPLLAMRGQTGAVYQINVTSTEKSILGIH